MWRNAHLLPFFFSTLAMWSFWACFSRCLWMSYIFFGRLDTAPLGDVTAYFFLSLASLSCCCFHCSPSSLIFYVWRVAQAIPFFWQAVRHLCFFLFLLFRWRDYKYILRKRPCNKIMIIMAFGIGTLARRNRVWINSPCSWKNRKSHKINTINNIIKEHKEENPHMARAQPCTLNLTFYWFYWFCR